jgi:hypothetical protein
MRIQERVFGRWQDKSVNQSVHLKVPGLYFLAARTWGFKGLIGGTHSWLTHVGPDLAHTVIEVTNIETLHVQGSTCFSNFTGKPASPQEHMVYMSNRPGDQLWFGHKPEVVYVGPLALDLLLDWTEHYPRLNHSFHVLHANCNTFTSWILHLLDVELWTGFGAKNWAKIAK